IDAGTKADWYQFSRNGYDINTAGAGGIATTGGGNIKVEAGRDLLSFLPTIGAFSAGNVSLAAGRRIFGNFLVRNGTGLIHAGADLGSIASAVSLNLVAGSWNIDANGDVYLNEVRNPNAVFNSNKPAARFNGVVLPGERRVPFFFDYAP